MLTRKLQKFQNHVGHRIINICCEQGSTSSRKFCRWDAVASNENGLWGSVRRMLTTSAVENLSEFQAVHFPGAKAPFSTRMEFTPATPLAAIPCFRVLDDLGVPIEGAECAEVSEALAVSMYRKMAELQAMDAVLFDAQRQGRFSFYMTTGGEEAVNIASAAALDFSDQVFAQDRVPRGSTQIPHAVGAAYGLKASEEQSCAVAYFGEGAASEGDFHGALNFAAVLDAPVLFLCRNNGWAISTPAKEQYKGDGIAGRGQGYGIETLRVDGNDALAIYTATKEARRRAVTESRPLLIEFMTYRVGHHSTSDDSSRYREVAEIEDWKTLRDPVVRFKKWLEANNWWSETEDEELRKGARDEVIKALNIAEQTEKPPLIDMFTDVYDVIPPNLLRQAASLRKSVLDHPDSYPKEIV